MTETTDEIDSELVEGTTDNDDGNFLPLCWNKSIWANLPTKKQYPWLICKNETCGFQGTQRNQKMLSQTMFVVLTSQDSLQNVSASSIKLVKKADHSQTCSLIVTFKCLTELHWMNSTNKS